MKKNRKDESDTKKCPHCLKKMKKNVLSKYETLYICENKECGYQKAIWKD